MDFNLLTFLAQSAPSPGWDFWPFSSGYGESWLPMLARIGFMLVILGGISLFLRLLFGPRGLFRDHELDREAEEMRVQELAELEMEYERGELAENTYRLRKKRLSK